MFDKKGYSQPFLNNLLLKISLRINKIPLRKLSKTSLIVIVIALMIVASIVVLESFSLNGINQENLNNNRRDSIKANITSFSVSKVGWLTPNIGVGIEFLSVFNVTVQNFGEKELDGLNITIQKLTIDNESQDYTYTYVNSSFSLQAGESAQLRVNLETDHIDRIFDNHENFKVTLYQESIIIDQRKLYQ